MKPIIKEHDGLDEMQKAHRDRIGNQSFFLLFYLLLIDCGLSSFGFRWLNYPANVMVIIMVVMGISLVRMILKNAYVGPRTKKRSVTGLIIAAVLSVSIALFLLLSDLRTMLNLHTSSSADNSAMILFIVSSVILIIALVVSLIRRKQNRDDEKKP